MKLLLIAAVIASIISAPLVALTAETSKLDTDKIEIDTTKAPTPLWMRDNNGNARKSEPSTSAKLNEKNLNAETELEVSAEKKVSPQYTWGLKWLSKHQAEDGSWSPAKFGGLEKHKQRDTSLALLAFLGAGSSQKFGKYKRNVKKATEWLLTRQQISGRISHDENLSQKPLKKWRAITDHAYAAAALVESYGMSESKTLKPKAQASLDWLVAQKPLTLIKQLHNNEGLTNDDMDGLEWILLALKSGKIGQLKIDKKVFLGFRELAKSSPETIDGVTYFKFFGRPASVRDTMIGYAMHSFTGNPRNEIAPSAQKMIKSPTGVQAWDKSEKVIDWAHTYSSTLVYFQMGHRNGRRLWYSQMRKVLYANQITIGTFADTKGAWPASVKSKKYSQVIATAIATSCVMPTHRCQIEFPQ